MAILSIQSHVAYGHVGNRAAVFPLERLGFEVWPINTVQFSNHSGYESWTGEVFTSAHLSLVWSGVKGVCERGECEAVLSGYLGAAEVGQFILEAVDDVKSANQRALYCCDPVIGDYRKGVFVSPGIPEFISAQAIRWADIVTPNQFEAEMISGSAISSIDDAKAACETMHKLGPTVVLITSFKPDSGTEASISMFLSSDKGFHTITTPELPLNPPLGGAGDLTAALFLARYLRGRDAVGSLEQLANSIFGVFERTFAEGRRELSLVDAQEEIVHPRKRFEAVKV